MTSQQRIAEVLEDLLDAMADADVLETFRSLSPIDQQRFSNWITKARDDESHWRRIEALVLALRIGPLGSGGAQHMTSESVVG